MIAVFLACLVIEAISQYNYNEGKNPLENCDDEESHSDVDYNDHSEEIILPNMEQGDKQKESDTEGSRGDKSNREIPYQESPIRNIQSREIQKAVPGGKMSGESYNSKTRENIPRQISWSPDHKANDGNGRKRVMPDYRQKFGNGNMPRGDRMKGNKRLGRRQNLPGGGIPGGGMPGGGMPGGGMPGGGMPGGGMPGGGMPGGGMPGGGMPGGGMPGGGMPGGGMPGGGMPGGGMPGGGMPGGGMPGGGMPGGGMPGGGMPGGGMPGGGMPGGGMPDGGMQGEGMPSGGMQGEGMQGEGMPSGGMQGEGMQGEGMPGGGMLGGGMPGEGMMGVDKDMIGVKHDDDGKDDSEEAHTQSDLDNSHGDSTENEDTTPYYWETTVSTTKMTTPPPESDYIAQSDERWYIDFRDRHNLLEPFQLPPNTKKAVDLDALPLCRCPRVYWPACATNKITYLNVCILKCLGKVLKRYGTCINYRRLDDDVVDVE